MLTSSLPQAGTPIYMYLAFQNVHSASTLPELENQAPLATVKKYATTVNDTYVCDNSVSPSPPPTHFVFCRLERGHADGWWWCFSTCPSPVRERAHTGVYYGTPATVLTLTLTLSNERESTHWRVWYSGHRPLQYGKDKAPT